MSRSKGANLVPHSKAWQTHIASTPPKGYWWDTLGFAVSAWEERWEGAVLFDISTAVLYTVTPLLSRR